MSPTGETRLVMVIGGALSVLAVALFIGGVRAVASRLPTITE